MSSLLKEAIVDAHALKEAALKNAEAAIIEKYSNEVKETIDKLLEQDELDLELGGELGEPAQEAPDASLAGEPLEEVEEVTEDDIPLAAADGLSGEVGVGLEEAPTEGEEIEFNVNLGALQEAIEELRKELDEDEEIEINEEDLEKALSEEDGVSGPITTSAYSSAEDEDDTALKTSAAAQQDQLAMPEEVEPVEEDVLEEEEQELDISEELVDAIMEKLTVDMGATLSGWAGRSSEDMKWELTKALSARRSTGVEEDLEDLKKAQEELVFENNQLKERNTKYEQALTQLQENLQDINLSNARLLYTNRVLRNASLNERQKEKIVEAISNAGSVTEAKTIFNTLQSTMEAKPTKQSPQSLSEALGRRPSTLRASRKEVKPVDTMSERMKKLAGIK
jgi:hypothetical protein